MSTTNTTTTTTPVQFLDKDGLSKLWERIKTGFSPRWTAYKPAKLASDTTPHTLHKANDTDSSIGATATNISINFASAGKLQQTNEDGTVTTINGEDITLLLETATADKAGILTAADKTRIDNIEKFVEENTNLKAIKVNDTELVISGNDAAAGFEKFINWNITFNSDTDTLDIIDLNNKLSDDSYNVLTSVNVKDFISEALVEGFLYEASLVDSKPSGESSIDGTFIKLVFKTLKSDEVPEKFEEIYIDVADLIDIYVGGEGISISESNKTLNDSLSPTSIIKLNAANTTTLGGIRLKAIDTAIGITAKEAVGNPGEEGYIPPVEAGPDELAINSTDKDNRYFGVETGYNDVAYVNVPIGTLSTEGSVENETTTTNGIEVQTIDLATGGNFNIITGGIAEEIDDCTGNLLTFTSNNIVIGKETNVSKTTSSNTDADQLKFDDTFRVLTGITLSGTNDHTIQENYTTFQLPDLVDESAEGDPDEITLQANNITNVTVLSDIEVIDHVIKKSYSTIDIFVDSITDDDIAKLIYPDY